MAMLSSVWSEVATAVLSAPVSVGLLIGLLGLGVVVGTRMAAAGAAAASGLLTAALGSAVVALSSGDGGPAASPWALSGVVLVGVGAGTVHVDTRARRQRVARAPQGLAAAAAVLTLATLGALVAAPVTLGPGGTRAVATAVAALTGAGAAWCAHRIEGRGLLSVAFTTVVRPVLRGAVVIRVVGQVPAHAAVLVSNHPSYLDGPAVMAVDDRIRPVARPQRAPLLRAALSLSGSVVVGRGAVGAGRTHLDRGGLLWLAPEGHRTGAVLERGRTGAARLAAAAGVPIVPVAMRYPEGHGPVGSVGPRLRDWRPWRRPHLVIDIGAPLHPRADETVEHTTRRVMQALAAHTGIPLSPVATSTPMPA